MATGAIPPQDGVTLGTEKSYWVDPFASEFRVASAEALVFEGKPALVLPATLFYPEGGGQLGDRGTLAFGARSFDVVDTQIDDAGTIFHVLGAEPGGFEKLEGGELRGAIDVPRRRDHMAQHTAQHMLSRALHDVARAPTVSARLGATSCTIDVEKSALEDAELFAIEDLVNDVIRRDVPVRAFFPSDTELATLDLRRAPKVSSGVRILEIEGFDLTPCGGTHCTRTGQIGHVRVASVERYKGKMRVSFHAAKRADEDARARARVLDAITTSFSCGPEGAVAAIDRLRAELKDREAKLANARGELAVLAAEALLAAHPPAAEGTTTIVVERRGDDVGFLRTLAGRLTQRPDVVALCTAPDGDALAIVVQRGAAATSFDCGAWLKAKAAASGGRGGGRPERAEGRLPVGIALP